MAPKRATYEDPPRRLHAVSTYLARCRGGYRGGSRNDAERLRPREALTRRSACVKLSNMKRASVREVQHNLAEILSWVERGQEVRVFRRRKLIARLVPPIPEAIESPDFLTRAQAIWKKKPRGKRLCELVSEGRGDR